MNKLEELIDELKMERNRQVERLHEFFMVHSYHTHPPLEPHIKYVLLQRIVTDLEGISSELGENNE